MHHFWDVDCRGTRGVVWYGMTRPRHASGLLNGGQETEARAGASYILRLTLEENNSYKVLGRYLAIHLSALYFVSYDGTIYRHFTLR